MRIAKFEERIEEQMRPFATAVETWTSIPGIDRITAWTIVAEMGPDMASFPTAAHAASWAGLCPGQEESAGKRKSGRTRQGNVWLRRALTQAAWGASMKKGSYFKAFYHRLAARKGKKRATRCRACIAVNRLHAAVDWANILRPGRRLFRSPGS